MTGKNKKKNSRIIQSIQRALNIMDCFDTENDKLSLKEISKKLALNRGTAHGIINTLLVNGYMEQDQDSGKYLLGKKLISKALLVSERIDLKAISESHLKYISEKYNTPAYIFGYKYDDLFLLDKVYPENTYYITSSLVGKKMPFYATASGKLLLAHMDAESITEYIANTDFKSFTDKTVTNKDELEKELEKIRKNQYAVEKEEVEIGIYSLAVPIYNKYNKLTGTLSITSNHNKIKSKIDELIVDLKRIGNEISKSLNI